MSASFSKYYLAALQRAVIQQYHSQQGEAEIFSYNTLSKDIFRTTGIKIHETHLKRIFGKVQFDQHPPVHQLDTLCIYIGQESWEEFKNNAALPVEWQAEASPAVDPVESVPYLPLHFTHQQELLLLLVLFSVLITGILILNVWR